MNGRLSTRPNHNVLLGFLRHSFAATAVVGAIGLFAPAAQAQTPILEKGAAVVTGFSGAAPSGATAPKTDRDSGLFIDLSGASARILDLSDGGRPPQAQLITSPTLFQAKAGEIGQVFGVTLDDGRGPDGDQSGLPDIYLSATSAFGLQIVQPDATGRLTRVRTGRPGVQWMPGQWGDAAKGGSPGSIWKINGATGAISRFAEVTLSGQANAGPGLGNLAFDPKSRQIFVSDLSTGMIHRFDMHGADLGYYDHGTQGRPTQALTPVSDNPSQRLKISDPAFNSQDAATWHFAPKGRMVWGLRMNGDRLYYAVSEGPQVWSISIGADGSFGSDPRLEIDVTGTPAGNAISSIAFDGQGSIYLAQRGAFHGDYSYKYFADNKTSALLRYHRDTKTRKWLPTPEEYAVGFPPKNHNTNGGVALGYGYDESGKIIPGSCGQMVWTTGELLRQGAGAPGPEIVHGLQGVDPKLVRPANEPPRQSYFASYNASFTDTDAAGLVGGVAIWQPCTQSGLQSPASGATAQTPGSDSATLDTTGMPDTTGNPNTPPIFLPPGVTPPPGTTPPANTFNLRLTKEVAPFSCPKGALCPHPPVASPNDCVSQFGKWICSFKIVVKNTGTTPYAGPLTINDVLPAAPTGSNVTFSVPSAWTCTPGVPSSTCTNPGVMLNPGDHVDIGVVVDFPTASQDCSLVNQAAIAWSAGVGDANPADDSATATANVPNANCPQKTGDATNLMIHKVANPKTCKSVGNDWSCTYVVTVTNAGPGAYSGTIKVDETLPAGTTASFSGPWSCPGAGPVYSCALAAGASINPGTDAPPLNVTVTVPAGMVKPGACDVLNKVHIAFPVGGTTQNTHAGDDDFTATATIGSPVCLVPPASQPKLKIDKSAKGPCVPFGNQAFGCAYQITVTNLGPGTYNDNIEVTDVMPAGTNFTGTESGTFKFLICSNTVSGAKCVAKPEPIAQSDSRTFGIDVRVPADFAKAGNCDITNQVSISYPAQLPVPSASGTAQLPAADCQIPKPPIGVLPPRPDHESNLAIKKVPRGCLHQAAGWRCQFDTEITNTGPAKYTGSHIEVGEEFSQPPVSVDTTHPAYGTCKAVGANFSCDYANITIAKGQTLTVDTISVILSDAQLNSGVCNVKDTGTITSPAGRTEQNTVPTDDQSDATDYINVDMCGPPRPPESQTNLELTTIDARCWDPIINHGNSCDWKYQLKNTGPGSYNGSVTLAVAYDASLDTNPIIGKSPCTRDGDRYLCVYAISLKANESFQTGFFNPIIPKGVCFFKEWANIELPKGGWSTNTNPNDDMTKWSSFTGDPSCTNSLADRKTSSGHVSILKTCTPSASGGALSCRITLTNDGPVALVAPVSFGDQGFWKASKAPLQFASAKPDDPAIACSGLPASLTCTLPASALPPGEKHSVDVVVGPGGQGDYHNCASLKSDSGADIGTPSCVDGGNDITVKKTAPATCTYGQDCAFQVSLTNSSGQAFSGPLQLADLLTLGGKKSNAAITSIIPPLDCDGLPSTLPIACAANVSLAGHESHSHTITVRIPSDGGGIETEGTNCFVAVAPNGSPANAVQPAAMAAGDGNGYSCVAFKLQPPSEPCPGQLQRIGTQCKCPEGTRPGANHTCKGSGGFVPVPVPSLSPPPQREGCPNGEVKVGDGLHCCPEGASWQRERCVVAGNPSPPPPIVRGRCPRGQVKVDDGNHCCRRGWSWKGGECVAPNKEAPPPPVPSNSCPRGQVKVDDGNHCCRIGWSWKGGECVAPKKETPPPPKDRCPSGQAKSNGNHCCPIGSVWDGRCIGPSKSNGGRSGGGNPKKNPQRIQCSRGTHYDGSSCVPNRGPPIFKNFPGPQRQKSLR